MLKIVVFVEAELEETPGVKELLSMAIESVPGARVRGVAQVDEV